MGLLKEALERRVVAPCGEDGVYKLLRAGTVGVYQRHVADRHLLVGLVGQAHAEGVILAEGLAELQAEVEKQVAHMRLTQTARVNPVGHRVVGEGIGDGTVDVAGEVFHVGAGLQAAAFADGYVEGRADEDLAHAP